MDIGHQLYQYLKHDDRTIFEECKKDVSKINIMLVAIYNLHMDDLLESKIKELYSIQGVSIVQYMDLIQFDHLIERQQFRTLNLMLQYEQELCLVERIIQHCLVYKQRSLFLKLYQSNLKSFTNVFLVGDLTQNQRQDIVHILNDSMEVD
jgi:hypothetical protein